MHLCICLPPLPKVGCPKFLEIRNPWGKKWSQNWTFLLRSGLKSPRKKKVFCCCWFCLIFRGRTGVEPILLHAWSPKNGGWVESIHSPRVDPSCGRADACMRGRVDAWTRQQPSFFFFFFLDKSRKLSKIVSVLQSASVERFDVSRMRDFLSYQNQLSDNFFDFSS